MNPYHVLEAVGILVSGFLFYSYSYSWISPGSRRSRLRRALLARERLNRLIGVEATAPAGEMQPILDTRKSGARGAGPDPVSSSLPPARPPVAPAQ
ncbi:MAG: hypothetical protein HYV93_05855 [Candidatus Rokubacteria bacterium]|nr:hypothetical protein [Candidatus Rokubacteria bacterium]